MLKYLLLFCLTTALAPAAANQEIESLIRFVGDLPGASFIRNGSAHPPVEAMAHLRLKWSKQQDDIKTAEDFIRLCATESSMSGQPYLIRFADGREETCAKVLRAQLMIIRDPKRSPAGPG
jgi:hypothetical protein